MKTVGKWLATIGVFALVASAVYPFLVRAQRPQRQTFRILKTFAQEARDENMSAIRKYTQQSVVLEGPCSGGCEGGVLRVPLPDNIRQSISGLTPYRSEATSLIWLRNIKPISVARRNDIFGEDELTIYGKSMSDGRNYFAAIPAILAAPKLNWIFVETNE